MKKDIRAYTYEQLAAEMEQIGEKKFRAKQIYEWLHVKLADSFEEMTNLSKALREKLEAEYEILPVKMLERQISKIDATNKFLFQLSDGNVSTCGIVPKIRELAMEHLQITLALSLHGSTQEKRKQLMPVANKYDLQEVLKACDFYFQETGRRVTFEYSLVHGVNDTQEDAEELIGILKSRNCHLNLIPVNPIKERDFQQPSRKNALNFKNKLEKSGINVTIRREMGADIDGACGQLRRRYVKTENE